MINILGCLAAVLFGFFLSNVESIGMKEAKILTVIGWSIALFCAQGGF